MEETEEGKAILYSTADARPAKSLKNSIRTQEVGGYVVIIN